MNLFISTATDKVYIMTFMDKKVIDVIVHQGKNDHTTTFYDLLKGVVTDFNDVKNIYVVNGPGSYTGLRVGIMFAKTMGMELSCNLYPLNLLEVLYETNGHVPVGVDAKGKKYYTYDGLNHDLVLVDELSDKLLCDPIINLEALLVGDYLDKVPPVAALELGVNYVKSAI